MSAFGESLTPRPTKRPSLPGADTSPATMRLPWTVTLPFGDKLAPITEQSPVHEPLPPEMRLPTNVRSPVVETIAPADAVPAPDFPVPPSIRFFSIEGTLP